jgi:DNA mismatch repair ATPase MutS
MKATIRGTDTAFHDLELFAGLLVRMERNELAAPLLRDLVRRLSSHSLTASETIGRLARIVDFADARDNPFLRALDTPLLYSVHVALAAERWRRDHGKVVREWIAALGEFEALSSLAGYSYEHPQDPFPDLVEGPATLLAADLGHPLLPAAKCVRNSVSLEVPTRVLLVSGSNMSGKSTLLRTVGINTVLAMAGAPVRARSLRLTPLQVGASIRVNDSLHEGSSRFYAEITRLREIYGLLAGKLPVLFLLDELLQGTNSKDRLIGAEGIVRAFVAAGAIGLVSTHDLALTDISGLAPGTLRNVHFQDDLTQGQMRFDFILRDGVVTRSNGIELMRAIGLKV